MESVHLFGTQVPLFKSAVYLFGTRKKGNSPPFGTQVNDFWGTRHRFSTQNAICEWRTACLQYALNSNEEMYPKRYTIFKQGRPKRYTR